MTIRYFKIIFFMAFTVILFSTAFAQTGGNYEPPPRDAVAAARDGEPYYAGMTKDQLHNIFPASSH